MTDPPDTLTYSSVVSKESIRIGFLIAALNGLDVLAADIGNVYIIAPCKEKIWTKPGSEFERDHWQVMLIVQSLYGLKSSGAAWHKMFADGMYSIGCIPSKADPDVWMRPAITTDNLQKAFNPD